MNTATAVAAISATSATTATAVTAAAVDSARRHGLLRGMAGLGCIAMAPPAAVSAWLGVANAARAQTPPAAAEAPPEVVAAMAQARLQGQGALRFLGLRVYEARLWTAAGQAVTAQAWAQQPLALDIRYQRALNGAQIAERSLQEMKRQGDIDGATSQRWLQVMTALFPDVVAGTRITGLNVPRVGARFYVDGVLKGAVDEADFARRFFGIWLAPQSSEPALRNALLGAGAAPAAS